MKKRLKHLAQGVTDTTVANDAEHDAGRRVRMVKRRKVGFATNTGPLISLASA